MATAMRKRLLLYKANKPYREQRIDTSHAAADGTPQKQLRQ
jgi:hypothetical protein